MERVENLYKHLTSFSNPFIGGGIVILLSGAPGVGKTLTAESGKTSRTPILAIALT